MHLILIEFRAKTSFILIDKTCKVWVIKNCYKRNICDDREFVKEKIIWRNTVKYTFLLHDFTLHSLHRQRATNIYRMIALLSYSFENTFLVLCLVFWLVIVFCVLRALLVWLTGEDGFSTKNSPKPHIPRISVISPSINRIRICTCKN